MAQTPIFWAFGRQVPKHPQYLPTPTAVRACPVFFMAKFSPLPEGLLKANGMGVPWEEQGSMTGWGCPQQDWRVCGGLEATW